MIQFEAAHDRVRFTAAYRRILRNPFMPYRGTGMALGLLAVVALIPEPRIVAAILAGAAVLFFFFSPALMLHRAVEAKWRSDRAPGRWTLSDEGVRCQNEDGDGLIRWQAVRGVEPMPGQLLVRLDSKAVVIVPTVTLSPEQHDELIAFVRDRGLLAGHPRPSGDQGGVERLSD